MRLIDKIAKLASPDAYRSTWRGVQRALHPLPVSRFLSRIDQPALSALAEQHKNALLPGQNWTSISTPRAGSSSTSAARRISA